MFSVGNFAVKEKTNIIQAKRMYVGYIKYLQFVCLFSPQDKPPFCGVNLPFQNKNCSFNSLQHSAAKLSEFRLFESVIAVSVNYLIQLHREVNDTFKILEISSLESDRDKEVE